MKPKKNKIIIYFLSLLVSLLAGWLGAFFTKPAIADWYALLIKPSLTPPAWVFAPAWTTLFILIGLSLALVLTTDNRLRLKQSALVVFAGQWLLNVSWSVVFFGLRSISWGLVIILVLWLLIINLIYRFSAINKLAGLLLWPYLLWVSFATYLNFSLWLLN